MNHQLIVPFIFFLPEIVSGQIQPKETRLPAHPESPNMGLDQPGGTGSSFEKRGWDESE